MYSASTGGYLCSSCYFFYFQAEDGIRDGHVTGVQTCALPIWSDDLPDRVDPMSRWWESRRSYLGVPSISIPMRAGVVTRSEERRVGKESRSRKRRQAYQKKDGEV